MSTSAADVGAVDEYTTAGKFLTFFLDAEEYGLEITKVHEIVGAQPITRLPRTPDFLRGVINLRGKIVPVMDLRTRFGMPPAADDSAIIVVQLGDAQIGVTVDRLSEVLDIPQRDIEPPPNFDHSTDYLLGLAKTDGRVRLLLALDRVLDDEERRSLVQAA
ncbi:MAG TPA: chemotaxis protein CheW [Gemmatimonadaceae bacterium]